MKKGTRVIDAGESENEKQFASGYVETAIKIRDASLRKAQRCRLQADRLITVAIQHEQAAERERIAILKSKDAMPKGWIQREQEQAILDWILINGVKPVAIPSHVNGTRDTFKREVKDGLAENPIFLPPTSVKFRKAWERLMRRNAIKYQEDSFTSG